MIRCKHSIAWKLTERLYCNVSSDAGNIAKLLHRVVDEGGPGGTGNKDSDSVTIDGVAEDPNNVRKQVRG